jgi:hypothetical protein
MSRLRFLALLAVVGVLGVSSATALSRPARSGPLSGTWSGYLSGAAGSGLGHHHIRIFVNAGETGGSWRLSASCHGRLTLDSISDGYHHYRRRLASGATCAGGDIDCLKRAGANVYDAVTSHQGGEYDLTGTLHRVR